MGNDEKLVATGWGWYKITFLKQLVISPDMYWNDLAIFYSLQCDTNELTAPRCNLKKLKNIVMKACKEYDTDKIECIDVVQCQLHGLIVEHGCRKDFPMPISVIKCRQK